LTLIARGLKIVTNYLVNFPDKNQASTDKRINCSESGGDGKAGTAFQALPVIMGQYGASGKKRLKSRATRIIQGTKGVINFQTGLID
jgi:hypothetical protein